MVLRARNTAFCGTSEETPIGGNARMIDQIHGSVMKLHLNSEDFGLDRYLSSQRNILQTEKPNPRAGVKVTLKIEILRAPSPCCLSVLLVLPVAVCTGF